MALAFKVTGIALISEFAAQICKDAGEGALAEEAAVAGKVAVLALAAVAGRPLPGGAGAVGMKERPALVPWLALLLLLAFLPTVSLAAGDAQTQSLLEALDLGAWQAQAPELPLRELLERFSSGDFSIDLDGLRDAAVQSLLQEVRFSLPLLLRVCALSLLMSVLSRLRLSLVGEDVARVCELVLFLCATLPLAVDFMRLVAKGEKCIGALNGIAQSVLPTMLALLAALGGGSTVTAMQPMVLGAGALSTSLLQNLLLPLVRMTAVLVLVSAMTGENRFSNLVACLRSLCHWALGACFTAFLGLLTVKGLPAGAVDSVAVRTAKYTVDNLVPVVGGCSRTRWIRWWAARWW